MQNFININSAKKPENNFIPAPATTGFVKENNAGKSFLDMLNNLSVAKTDPITALREDDKPGLNMIDQRSNEKTGFGNNPIENKFVEKVNPEKALSEKEPKAVERHSIENDSNIIKDNKTLKDEVRNNPGNEIKEKNNQNPNLHQDRAENQRKAGEANNVKSKELHYKDKEKKLQIDHFSVLMREINNLLDILKTGLPDNKQTREIKSALLKFKNSAAGRKDGYLSIDREHGNSQAAIKDPGFRGLLDKLSKMLDQLKERDIKTASNYKKENIPFKELKDSDIKTEPKEPANFKKEITRLAEEIRQLLNGKKENITGKKEEFDGDKQNINNKIFFDSPKSEKAETHSRDMSQNFNFSFGRKESPEHGIKHAADASSAMKKNNFGDQFEAIVRNAKVFIRDGNNGSFSIKLHPESLGRVNVNLNLEQGVIVGKFLVDNAGAKEALLDNMNNVMESLAENGIFVGEFQVNVRDEKYPRESLKEESMPYTGNNSILETAGSGYELNSLRAHDGEIDYLI